MKIKNINNKIKKNFEKKIVESNSDSNRIMSPKLILNHIKNKITEIFNNKISGNKSHLGSIEKKLKLEKIKQENKEKKEKESLKKRKEIEERILQRKIRKKIKEKKSASQRKRFFEYMIDKAGYSIKIKDLRKKILFISIGLSLIETFFLIFNYIIHGTRLIKIIIDSFILLTLGTVFQFLVVLLLFFIFIDFKIYNRKKSVEEVLPEYLQLVAANIGAGMPIDQALWTAIRPQFGVLAKEMELVAKKSMTGTSLEIALSELSDKYDSALLQRTIFLLIEGINAGGPIAKLLDRITTDIIDTRIMKKEMAANVMTYVIFITFASVAAAPFMFGLANQLVVIIHNLMGSLNLSNMNSSMFQISDDAVRLKDFRIFSYIVLSITAMFSGMISSVIKNGNVKDGFKSIPMLMLITIIIFVITVKAMSIMFSGMF